MFKTLLWATDGSETAARALPYALGLAAGDAAKLVVVHVREIFVGRGGGYPVLADESELRARIQEQVRDLQADGLDATFIVRTCNAGHTARTIAEIADEVEADLIVVGTHGYGRVAGLRLGSVTQGLLHSGICPVLAVPTEMPAEAPEPRFETTVNDPKHREALA
jgi:nucleotide-binding universal stress UspA family protein